MATETATGNTEVPDTGAEDTGAEGTGEEQELDNAVENLSLDDLMSITGEDYEEFSEDAHHKGMQPLTSWMKHVPADVRKHIANIRSDYTRKTTEIAEMRRELEAQQAEMQRRNDTLVNGNLARQVADVDTDAEYDLFDKDGMKNEIKRQAALMLKEMMAPAQEELEVQQRKVQLEQFKAQNPELTDPEYRTEIVELLKNRPELNLEDAFYITKAKLGARQVAADQDSLAARKARQREVVRKSSGGTRTDVQGTPKFKNAVEAFKFHQAQMARK